MKKVLFLVALAGAFAASYPSSSASAAPLCYPENYPNCDYTDGLACTTPGTSTRCSVYPQYCEWGRCWCESNYTWNCVY
jgi:hypothetical protein